MSRWLEVKVILWRPPPPGQLFARLATPEQLYNMAVWGMFAEIEADNACWLAQLRLAEWTKGASK